jgi:hypothetical protein
MADDIDPAVLARRKQALAEWMNAAEDPGDREQVIDGEWLDGWHVHAVEEFLIFSSPGGYTNQLYLVGEGVVHPFSFARETQEYAVELARAERDGTEPPEPPGPLISQEEWDEFINR